MNTSKRGMWWCGGDERLEERKVDVGDPEGVNAVGDVGRQDGVGGEGFGGIGKGRVQEEGVDVGCGGGGRRRGEKCEVGEGRGDGLCDLCGERGGDVVRVDGGRAVGFEGREFGLDLCVVQQDTAGHSRIHVHISPPL